MHKQWNLDRIMRFVLLMVGVLVALALVYYLRGVLFPFFAAFLLAYIVDPIVEKLTKKFRYRIISVITVLLGAALVIGCFCRFFIPSLVREVRSLGSMISKMLTDSDWLERLSSLLPSDTLEFIQNIVSWDKLASAMQSLDFWKEIQNIVSGILPKAWGVLSASTAVFFWFSSAVIIFMYLVFIMLDMPKLRKGVMSLVPKRFRAEARSFASEINRFMGAYFRAQSLVALTVGILYAIGFGLMGLPMGVAFGLFSGALNMIPYLQLATIPFALLLAILHALNTGMSFVEVALIILAIYLVVQVIQDFFLVPHIVGKSMNLPPVGILLSLAVWGKLLGFLGLLVAIPFTCLCLVYLRKLQERASRLENLDCEKTEPPPEA